MTTLRDKLVKIGAKVVRHGRYVTFQLAEVAVPRDLFRKILSLIDDLRKTRSGVPRESTARRKRQERCVWMARKMPSGLPSAGRENHAIGWLHRGYSSLGGGKVVRIPRRMVYGECRLRRKAALIRLRDSPS